MIRRLTFQSQPEMVNVTILHSLSPCEINAPKLIGILTGTQRPLTGPIKNPWTLKGNYILYPDQAAGLLAETKGHSNNKSGST